MSLAPRPASRHELFFYMVKNKGIALTREKLKVSRRSLQQYRDSGLLAFTRLGGKILYRSSDIEKLLDGCYRKARTRPEEL